MCFLWASACSALHTDDTCKGTTFALPSFFFNWKQKGIVLLSTYIWMDGTFSCLLSHNEKMGIKESSIHWILMSYSSPKKHMCHFLKKKVCYLIIHFPDVSYETRKVETRGQVCPRCLLYWQIWSCILVREFASCKFIYCQTNGFAFFINVAEFYAFAYFFHHLQVNIFWFSKEMDLFTILKGKHRIYLGLQRWEAWWYFCKNHFFFTEFRSDRINSIYICWVLHFLFTMSSVNWIKDACI